MISVKKIDVSQDDIIEAVVSLHIETFKGFFLSSMKRGFLKTLYRSFCEHADSALLVAFSDEQPVGFLAYSQDTSSIYSYMLKEHFFAFGWYSFLSFLEKPSILKKMLGAFGMSKSTKRETLYVKVFSIGVEPEFQHLGVGSVLMDSLKARLDFSKYDYITLETDAENNDAANAFYIKNGFALSDVITTQEGRVMNKYHYRVRK